ncbi:MAG: 4Fe-4S binding protein [Deltaproteobacteria bacterium]|nr:MAG: 4Fe-4S binding protein [Deltaproteobacteria bacterium]
MKDFRYLSGVSTLKLDDASCVGCGMCEIVCPHRVMTVENHKAKVVDHDGCMECGACATNCPSNAIAVTPGVGCAAAIISTWLKGKEASSCSGVKCC